MAGSGAQTVGRTLARLATLAPRRADPAQDSAASRSRAQILHLIQASPTPISVESLCQQTNLHANTVRGHLDVLLAGGQVERLPGERHGRGRPPLLYTIGSARPRLYDELAHSLIDQLDDATDPQLIVDAAHRWAQVVERREAAKSPDAAVEQAADALRQLGFTAAVSPVGDTITLGTCPYAALVADQPVICDIHTALLGELLERSDQSVEVDEMVVWARPGLCLARLTRPDLHSARTITRTPVPGDAEGGSPPPSRRKTR